MDDNERTHYRKMIALYKKLAYTNTLIAFGTASVLVGFLCYVLGYDAGVLACR